jgi:hypothetical protein
MVTGWQRAAKKLLAGKPEQQVNRLRLPRLTFEEAAEIAATRQRLAARKKRRTVHSDLNGLQFDLLLAWDRLSNGDIPRYECLCACGNFCEADAHTLLRGRKKDCGCRKAERDRLRAWRRRQRLAKQGRQRAPWRRFTGMKAA